MPNNNGFYFYPNASMKFDVKQFYIWEQLQGLSTCRVGKLFLEISDYLRNGDFNKVKKYPWIIKISPGPQSVYRQYIPARTRRRVLSIGCCVVCSTTEQLTIDHKKPVSRGGTNHINNLQCMCRSCNSRKSNRYGK